MDNTTKRNRTWPWLTALVIIVAAAVIWALAGQPGLNRTSANVSAGPAITDMAAISHAPNQRQLAGRSVELTGATVQYVVPDKGFWITGTDDNRVFVLTPPQQPAPKPGDRVNVWGALEPTPGNPHEAWGVDSKAALDIQTVDVYVRASRIERTGNGK